MSESLHRSAVRRMRRCVLGALATGLGAAALVPATAGAATRPAAGIARAPCGARWARGTVCASDHAPFDPAFGQS